MTSGTIDGSGAQSYTVLALNSGGSDTTTLAFDVNAAPEVAYFASSKYLVSSPLSITPVITKGFPALTFAIQSGSLPSGLSLNASTGVISGSTAILGLVNATIRSTNAEGFDDSPVSFEIVNELPATDLGSLGISIDIGI